MSDVLPNDAQNPAVPEPDARAPVVPPMRGSAPAWDDNAELQPDEQFAAGASVRSSLREFTPEPGGRGGMAGTAERVGNAVGTAQRQMRRGIDLVRRPMAGSGLSAEELAREGMDRASRMVHDIEKDVSDARRQAAVKLDELSDLAGKRLHQLRLGLRAALSRSRLRAEEYADRYPLQTIAAFAGVCFVMGVALRFRRSHRG